MAFATFKPKQVVKDKRVLYRYATVYDALNASIYDLAAKDETDPFVYEQKSEGFLKLCKGLAEYINTTEEKCNEVSPMPDITKYMQAEEQDFLKIPYYIEALNGARFYLSDVIATPDESDVEEASKFRFYMVYVDLDANEDTNRPHTIKYADEGKVAPDVFAFAVIPTGEAIPMGIAEYNVNYLNTRIAYKVGSSTYFSPTYSYRKSKHLAWNYYAGANRKFNERISFTYNDKIRKILEEHNTQLYKFNENGEFEETYSDPIFGKCVPASDTNFTSYDICSVRVETPRYGTSH
jgi:hypothetical protein